MYCITLGATIDRIAHNFDAPIYTYIVEEKERFNILFVKQTSCKRDSQKQILGGKLSYSDYNSSILAIQPT